MLRGKLFALFYYFMAKADVPHCESGKCKTEQIEHFYELDEAGLPQVFNLLITWGQQEAKWTEIFYILLTLADTIDMN